MSQMNGTGQAAARERSTREIELTRERLGAMVEQLSARADLKNRAGTQAAELAGRVKTAAAKARQGVPGSARQAVSWGAGTAREKRVPLSVAAGAALAVTALAIWQRGKR
jgi:hypothetical protein